MKNTHLYLSGVRRRWVWRAAGDRTRVGTVQDSAVPHRCRARRRRRSEGGSFSSPPEPARRPIPGHPPKDVRAARMYRPVFCACGPSWSGAAVRTRPRRSARRRSLRPGRSARTCGVARICATLGGGSVDTCQRTPWRSAPHRPVCRTGTSPRPSSVAALLWLFPRTARSPGRCPMSAVSLCARQDWRGP